MSKVAAAAPKKYGFAASAGTKVGLEVWRIEKMDVVALDPKDNGHFHTGDCYIALNTYEGKDGRRNMDVHFWLGEKSTQDEQGAAAYKTVEIDTKLGGKPVQHREVQGFESNLFLSYFPKGIQYLEGGIETAFRHVDPTKFDARLFHLKGKRNVRVQQVERKSTSLNQGDVFILDMGLTLYQWNGSAANKNEKFKALELITKIKNDERGGKAKLVFLEHDTKNADSEAFYKSLGGSDGVKTAEQGGSDDDVKAAEPVTLFKVSDESGTLKVEKVADTKLERKMLDENDVFIVDSGAEVFVWVGGKATKQERESSMKHAMDYLKTNNRPSWVPITRIIATGETPPFKSLFHAWDAPKKVQFDKKDAKSAAAADVKADTSAMYKKQQQANEKMVDNASGKLTVWRINQLKKEEVPKEEVGQFFAGDSYICLYAYKKGSKDAWIIYFWQGRDSTSDEKAASALLTVELDDSLGGEPVQVRVTQGSEPQHFLALFKGKFVVHDGGYSSAFANRAKSEDVATSPIALYHIHGQNEFNTHAIQTTLAASSLNSGDCFALNTADAVYAWIGKGANDSERKCAASIAKIVGGTRKVVTVDEGKESDEFWTALGGKTEYPTSKELLAGASEPRLFHCTTAKTGAFKIDEIFNYGQDDLINDDVIILDAFSEVFVWVGHDSTKDERDNAFKAALDYVKHIADGRPANTPVFKVMAGSEPPNFTCHFHGWDEKKASAFEDKYAKALSAMGSAKIGGTDQKSGAAAAAASPTGAAGSKFQVKVAPQAAKKTPVKAELVTAADIGYADWKSSTATADDVRANKVANMDPAQKELYVADAEFQTIFKSSKADWLKLPAWKRTQAKQTARLF